MLTIQYHYNFCHFGVSRKFLHKNPFKCLFSGTTWISQYHKSKPFWMLMKQEIMWFGDGSGDGQTIFLKNLHLNQNR